MNHERVLFRYRQLLAARATGKLPPDMFPWLCNLAAAQLEAAGGESPTMKPAERLAIALSAEIDLWMTRRRVTHRTISCPRRTLARALKGENVSLRSVADIADSLGCDVVLAFRPRDGATDQPRDGHKLQQSLRRTHPKPQREARAQEGLKT